MGLEFSMKVWIIVFRGIDSGGGVGVGERGLKVDVYFSCVCLLI